MHQPKIKTIFLGTPRFAEIVLEILADSLYRPILVITEPDKPVGRAQTLTAPPVKLAALRLGIPVVQPTNHHELAEILRSINPDIGLVAAYGRILKPEVLAIPENGFLNVHASLLPKYRGASPIQSAILQRETETGVTIMEIDEGLDTGRIISWAPTQISPDETTPTLTEKLAELGGTLLIETIAGYLDGTMLARSQNDADATKTALLSRDSGQLTGNESTAEIEAMARAFEPWPGIWIMINDVRIILRKVQVIAGTLELREVQLAGKNPVSWQTFRRDRPELAKKIQDFLHLTD